MTTNETSATASELTVIPADIELAPEEKNMLTMGFTSFLNRIQTLRDQAALTVSPKMARVVRLEAKALRVESEKKHKAMKEGVLRYGRALDGAKNIIASLTIPIEEAMEEIEKAEERRIAAEIAARDAERKALLAPYQITSFGGTGANLGTMNDADFQTLLDDAKALHEARVKREQEEAAAKLARQVEEAKERERVRLENEKLLREAAEREEAAKLEREKAAREKAELEAKLAQERAEAERKLAAERDEARKAREAAELKERVAREKAETAARKEREALEAKAAEERAAREKAEAEAARQREELLEKQRQVIEAENARLAEEARKQREAEEAAEKAAQAPDKEKLLQYAKALGSIPIPQVKSAKAKKLVKALVTDILEAANSLREAAEKL